MPVNIEEEKLIVINTDKEFSKFSEENGIKVAFTKYCDNNGVILRQNSMPIVGIKAVKELYKNTGMEIKLIWEPLYCEIANSGELAYTYGTWKSRNKTNNDTSEGTYVSIWKKQKDSSWKWCLDSGNEGLGKKSE